MNAYLCFSPLHVGVIFTGSDRIQPRSVRRAFQSPSRRGYLHRTCTVTATFTYTQFQSPSRRGYLHRGSTRRWPSTTALVSVPFTSGLSSQDSSPLTRFCAHIGFSPLHVGVIFTGGGERSGQLRRIPFQSPSRRGYLHRRLMGNSAQNVGLFQSPSRRGYLHRWLWILEGLIWPQFQSPSRRGYLHRIPPGAVVVGVLLFQSPSRRGYLHRFRRAPFGNRGGGFSPLHVGVIFTGVEVELHAPKLRLFQSPSRRGYLHRSSANP